MENDQEQVWKTYLKKYNEIYRVKKVEDGIWNIDCLEGNHIGIFKSMNKELHFYFSGGKTSRAKNHLKKILRKFPRWTKIIQEGDIELLIAFHEADLPKFETLFKIRKRKRFTPEYRQQLIDRAKLLSRKP